MFYDFFNQPPVIPTCPGSEIIPIYEREEGDIGKPWDLVQVGERNIQKAIDSARPPCMSDILLHALRGDTSVLSNDSGFYATGDEPRSLGEVFLLGKSNILQRTADAYAAALEKEKEVNSNVDPAPAE